MQKLGLNEIREKFLSFFESKGHYRMPSFPLVPENDASLLLINSGMAPLKPFFTGAAVPPSKRVTTCQKCIRTPDIERVGKTARHATFFEMLGNFSFGDYFKREAISWAWEFVTQELKMPKDRLWVTIFKDDDEALEIWTKEIGVPAERVVKMGEEDNFWQIGTGPCGPCSEIYFDRGEQYGCGSPDCGVGCECDRFVEFWNLVFTQFERDENGNYHKLEHPNIDTGMGLERLAAIMQGVLSLFDVDTIKNIINHIAKIALVEYGASDETDVSLRVICDHIRSTTFLVADGVVPSNEGRGYVLRRLLRRAARHGKLLGIDKPFLSDVAMTVIGESQDAYPELKEKKDYIRKVISIEENRFDETIHQGLEILSAWIEKMQKQGVKQLSGADAFKLYDTYGFPIDLTREILAEKGMGLDEQAFEEQMKIQRERARSARQEAEEAGWNEDAYLKLSDDVKSKFIGYDRLVCDATVSALIADGEVVENISAGMQAGIICDVTVFYAESGGQVGDCGKIYKDGFGFNVHTTKKLAGDRILHIGEVSEGAISVGGRVTLEVDAQKRKATARNHSTTHLLHKALKETLGVHVAQAGSFVGPDRLRFDFSHFGAMTPEELQKTEALVNDAILSALPVTVEEMPFEQAKKLGAEALFGEKYGDVVRVVKMGDYSVELCGGCHLSNTSEAGMFFITSEGGIAAGVRRIEGVTGYSALEYIKNQQSIISETAQVLKANPLDIVKKAKALTEELKTQQKTIQQMQSKLAMGEAERMLSGASEVKGVKVIARRMDGLSPAELRNVGDSLRERLGCGLAVIASVYEGKATFAAVATKSAVQKGVHAGKLVGAIAKVAGGGGGGRPDSAQAGGKLLDKIDDALAMTAELVGEQVNE